MSTRFVNTMVAALMLFGAATFAAEEIPFVSVVGEAIPSFTATSTDGLERGTADAAPATMVHIFQCESVLCADSLKAVEQFVWQPLREKGVVVLAVARDSNADAAKALAAEAGITFPIVPDTDRVIAKLFSEEGKGVPRTIIADADGRVVYQHSGYSKGREAEFRMVIEALLAGRDVPQFGDDAAGGGGGSDDMARNVVGQKAPELHVEQWITVEPGDKTGKFQMMEFWATWCGPCRMSMPHLEELAKKHKDKLVIMSISDEPASVVKPFVRKEGYTYPIGIDTQSRTSNNLRIQGIPFALLVNPEGKVVWQGHPMSLSDEMLENYLSGK